MVANYFCKMLCISCQIAFKNAKSFQCADNSVKPWAQFTKYHKIFLSLF